MLNAGQLGKRSLTFAAIKLALAIVTVMMLAVGTFQIIETLTALSRHTYHADNNGLVLRVYCTEWGWIHVPTSGSCRC